MNTYVCGAKPSCLVLSLLERQRKVSDSPRLPSFAPGVNPQRLLSGFSWPEFQWRRGELLSEFQGKTVLVGVDDMDVFKGIELKLLAFERVLEHHQEWRSKLVLVQVRCCSGRMQITVSMYQPSCCSCEIMP
jgi:trehalose-6-phosphate synthase